MNYTKLFILFTVIALLAPSAFAQGEEPAALHPTAQSFVDRLQAFVDTKMPGVTGFDSAAYMATIREAAAQLPADADVSNFQPDAFMNGVEQRVQQMLGAFDAATNEGNLRGAYLQEIVNIDLAGYMTDMVGGSLATTADYLAFIDLTNSRYQNSLDALNPSETPGTGGTDIIDPEDYLDKGIGEARPPVQFDLYWTGIANWAGSGVTFAAIVNAFQARFAHDGINDAVDQANFQLLAQLWPQSAELYVMNSVYDNNIYNQGNTNPMELVVDSSGVPVNPATNGLEEVDAISNTVRNDGTYNNRSYGYADGTYTTISLTIGDRQYTLQENFYTSPLLFDMDGDGAIEASNGKWLPHFYEKAPLAEFDMDGDGFVDFSEWVGPNDGLLIVCNEGEEVNATHLFGTADGFNTGYEKLSLYDKNNDRKITADEFGALKIWQDKNVNARVDKGELASLTDMGITEISLAHDKKLVSSFVQNGVQKKMFDWYPCVHTVKRQK